jgi:hypothetical protein
MLFEQKKGPPSDYLFMYVSFYFHKSITKGSYGIHNFFFLLYFSGLQHAVSLGNIEISTQVWDTFD